MWDRSPLCYETYARCYGADMTRPAQLLTLVEQPDLLVLLDLDPEAPIKRIAARIDSRQTDEDEILLAEARARCT